MANADIVKSLLKIAKSDLRASKLLYKKNLFPQSIYFFQQSVEKINKALTIYGGFFTLSEARAVSHSQTKLVKGVLKRFVFSQKAVPAGFGRRIESLRVSNQRSPIF